MIQQSTLRVGVDSTGAVAGAAAGERAINRVGNSALATEGKMQVLKRGLMGLGGAFAALGIGVGGAGAIRTLANFEQSLATVRAVTNATESDMARLRKEAGRLGATTKFTASQAADAMVFLGRAGFKTNQILGAVPGTLQLAQAGALDLATAADIAAKTLAGFQLPVSDMSRVVDVLAFSASNAATDVQSIAEGMRFVAPVAKGMGVSLEETAAAMAQLSNAGLAGSMAGTGLRRVLSGLANPTKKATEVMKQYGLTAAQVSPITNDLADVLQLLADKRVPVNDLLKMFGDRGGPAAEVLKTMAGDVSKFTEALRGATGVGEKMANTMSDNLEGKLLGLGSAAESVVVAMGQAGLTGAMISATEAMSKGLRSVATNGEAVLAVVVGLLLRGLYPLAAGMVAASVSSLTASGSLLAYTAANYRAATASAALIGGAQLPVFMYQVVGATVAATFSVGRLAASLFALATGPTAIITGIAVAFYMLTKSANEAKEATRAMQRGIEILADLKIADDIKLTADEMRDLATFTQDADGALEQLTARQKAGLAAMQAQTAVMQAQSAIRQQTIEDELNAALIATSKQLDDQRRALAEQERINAGKGGALGALAVAPTAPIKDQIAETEKYQALLYAGIKGLKDGLLELGSLTVDPLTIVDDETILGLDEGTSALQDFMDKMRESIIVAGIKNELEKKIAENMFAAGLDYTTDRLSSEGQAVAYVTEELHNLDAAEKKRKDAEDKAKRDADKKIKTYQDYITEIQNEIAASALLDNQRTAALATSKVIADLKRSDIILTEDQITAYTALSLLQQQANDVAKARQGIYESLTSGYLTYQNTVLGLSQLQEAELITQERFNTKLREAQSALLQFKITAGDATFAEGFLGALDRMSESANNVNASMSQSFQGFFSSLRDGFADSVASSIVNAESFGDAIMSVARGAMQELLSSLIQLGINMLINRAIGQAVSASAVAASVLEAGALATAWAPAAALASLATLGTNAAPAAAGILGTTALAKAMAIVPGFAEGGWTGKGGAGGVAGVVHEDEFVVRKGPARQNRALLEAINAGRQPTSLSGKTATGPVSGVSMPITIGTVSVTTSGDEDPAASGRRAAESLAKTLLPLIDQRLTFHKRQGGMLSRG